MPATEFELKLWELRYKNAYNYLLSKQSPSSRQIIQDPNKADGTLATKFAKEVIELAESEDRIPEVEKTPSSGATKKQ